MKWEANAPSNIALIKYMGKNDSQDNTPANSSLSYTLDYLKTFVKVELLSSQSNQDKWSPLVGDNLYPLHLSDSGIERFLKHAAFLKKMFGFDGAFSISSANNFPSDCGLASSASSYAALTKAMLIALYDISDKSPLSVFDEADLSRKASGSSGRSFFSPWSIWQADGFSIPEIPYHQLIHCVVITDDNKKQVSSSLAHQRVTSSLLYSNRNQRAQIRLSQLIEAFQASSWYNAFEICWAEFWDMHALFETASPSFGYMTSASLEVLQQIKNLWQQNKNGPLVTMDAGPNVHLLFRSEDKPLALDTLMQLKRKFMLLSSLQDFAV